MSTTANSQLGSSGAVAAAGGSAALTAPLPAARSFWLLNSWGDLLLFVGTPLLILPLLTVAKLRFSIAQIGLVVAAFGALGHNLPGMMRAYGDRALFDRFRVRFVLAPLFLLVVCEAFALRDLPALDVIVLVWGLWHAAMQVYGFARIYDTKVASFSSVTARLDWLMCLAWFGGGVVASDWKKGELLWIYYKSGGPLVPSSIVLDFGSLWTIGTALITVAFAANALWQWFKGTPPSAVKLLLMASSFGFWWYAIVVNRNIILGVAMWEMFHDVQYLSIVWMYNRNRVEKGHSVGAFTRYLFRRSGAMVGLYTGLVFAYGYIAFLPSLIDVQVVSRLLHGFIAASGLLHFYFDGFIWKVRDAATREGLGLRVRSAARLAAPGLPPWLLHGMKWGAFVGPVACLGYLEWGGRQPSAEQCRTVVDVAPGYCQGQLTLGVALASQGQLDEATQHLDRALELEPDENDHAYAHYNLGVALGELGRPQQAVEHLRRALELKPDLAEAHSSLAERLHAEGKDNEALAHYRQAAQLRRKAEKSN